MSIRESFVSMFGEDQAVRIEEAALQHMNGMGQVHSQDSWGSDPFRYMILGAIGWECVTRFAEFHGITIDPVAFQLWVLDHADLHEHDGDMPDYLSLMAGAYLGWINWAKAGIELPRAWLAQAGEQEENANLTLEEVTETIKNLTQILRERLDQ